MTHYISVALGALALSMAGIAVAQHGHAQGNGAHTAGSPHKGLSPHAGKQLREIPSLSEQDLKALRAGTGWGLALPAEINGAPGPRHVLDLADELNLTADQINAIEDIFVRMRASALENGERFIAAERALNEAFVKGDLDQNYLETLVKEAATARARLRLAHLSAHLETLPLLNDRQIESYARLRGYGAADACQSVPQGHDPDMWRKHNQCP